MILQVTYTAGKSVPGLKERLAQIPEKLRDIAGHWDG